MPAVHPLSDGPRESQWQCGYHAIEGTAAPGMRVPPDRTAVGRTACEPWSGEDRAAATRRSHRTLRSVLWRPIILGDMNAWSDTWSADAARNGDISSLSPWLGIDVDHFSEPVLGNGRRDL